MTKEQALVDRLRWIYQQKIISLDLATEICDKHLYEIIHFLDELVALKTAKNDIP